MEQFEYLQKVFDLLDEGMRPRCKGCSIPIPSNDFESLCPLCDVEMRAKIRSEIESLRKENDETQNHGC